ncbi:MAG TPA: glycosyltransferase family 1 protein [Candidatus Krumholzibacteria bacterium]|nr:glycosyltransferase family 1 protein [Candidatus Krumholzibacteria bacterium]
MSRAPLMVDARWRGAHGIGRFAHEILSRLPGSQALPLALRPLHPLEPLALHWVLRRARPRLYFTPGFNPPWRSPVPVVMTIYDLIHLRFPQESSLTKRLYYREVVRDAARRGARVLTLSQFSQDEILEWTGIPPERVHVVGAGVTAAFSPQGPCHDPGHPYLLYVGNHKPHKNLSRLVRAFTRLPRDWNVHLLLTGHAEAALRDVARSAGVADRIVDLGEVEESILPDYYRGARGLVLPSLYEGFGLPALEAMACGTPVLAANVTALPETVGDAALLVQPDDTDALAAGMERLLHEAELRERLGRAGPARAQRFTWDRVAARVQGVLEAPTHA